MQEASHLPVVLFFTIKDAESGSTVTFSVLQLVRMRNYWQELLQNRWFEDSQKV
jgi:hypothetical protein